MATAEKRKTAERYILNQGGKFTSHSISDAKKHIPNWIVCKAIFVLKQKGCIKHVGYKKREHGTGADLKVYEVIAELDETTEETVKQKVRNWIYEHKGQEFSGPMLAKIFKKGQSTISNILAAMREDGEITKVDIHDHIQFYVVSTCEKRGDITRKFIYGFNPPVRAFKELFRGSQCKRAA